MADLAMNREAILDAMARLPVEQRAVIRRSYYERWSIAQIADDLQIDEKTVTARLHYGVRALLLSLEEAGVTRHCGLAPHLHPVPAPPRQKPETANCTDDSLQDQR